MNEHRRLFGLLLQRLDKGLCGGGAFSFRAVPLLQGQQAAQDLSVDASPACLRRMRKWGLPQVEKLSRTGLVRLECSDIFTEWGWLERHRLKGADKETRLCPGAKSTPIGRLRRDMREYAELRLHKINERWEEGINVEAVSASELLTTEPLDGTGR